MRRGVVTVERDSGVLLWDLGFFRRLLPGIQQSRCVNFISCKEQTVDHRAWLTLGTPCNPH